MNAHPKSDATPSNCGAFIGAVVIFLLVFAIYWPALRGQFVWDDQLLIDRNPLVKGDLNLATIWFRTDFPLSMVALWAQWLLWGDVPTGYHIVNVVLHAINALMVWRLLAQLRVSGAWLGALLFAVHPICVASVAWISELKNTLSLLFFLLSLSWYLKCETRDSDFRKWYWLSLSAFVLALLSKTSTIMLPVVLLGCAWWQRGQLSRQDLLRTGPYFALSLAFGLMSIWFQKHQASAGISLQTEDFFERLALAARAVWFYLSKAVLPVNLSLMYPRWEGGSGSAIAWLLLILLCLAFAVFWKFRRGWGRHGLFALGFFVVNLFPVLGFFDMYYLAISRVSDHFLYIPVIAVTATAGAATGSFLRPQGLKCVVPALIAALSILTVQRARVFADEEKLWNDTLAKNPAAWLAHNNMGVILAKENKTAEARRHFEASLKFNPRNPKAHINLGRALAMQDRFAEADAHFRAALDINPQDAEARRAYAQALASQKRTDEAIGQLRESLRVEPAVDVRLQLADLLRQTGQFAEAAEQCRNVLLRKPDMPEALNNLAWLLATAPDASLRNGTEAVRLAEQACRLTEFKQARIVGALAAAYAEAGRFEDAVKAAEQASKLAEASGDAQFAGINRQLLDLYRERKPYHEPARP